MGIYKKIVLGLITTVTMVNLMSCSGRNENEKISNEETNYYFTMLEGKKIYYSEEDDDVMSAKEITKLYLNHGVKTDYRNKDYLKEYDLYTKEQQEINELNNNKEETEELVTSWKLVLELDSYDIKEIEFYKLKGQESATVIVDYTTTILEATDAYLEKRNRKINETITRTMTLYIVKEDNEWRVNTYDVN